MIEMSFQKDTVLAKLRENLNEHRVIFSEAVEGYRDECLKQLDESIERLENTPGPVSICVMVAPPENHEADYEAVISMLGNSLDAQVTFSDQQYRCYMLDQWDWQRHFLASNSVYSMTATEKAVGLGS